MSACATIVPDGREHLGQGVDVADELHVDTAALRGTGERLRGLGEVVREVEGGSLLARRGDYGHAGLSGAASGFAARWGVGLQALTGEVRQRGDALVSVAEVFEQADAALGREAQDLPGPR